VKDYKSVVFDIGHWYVRYKSFEHPSQRGDLVLKTSERILLLRCG
jgi:hypothetical protein